MNVSYWFAWHFYGLFARAFFNYRVIGRENLSLPGGALIACNHASFLDPPFTGVAFDEQIYYLARKTLFKHPVAGAILRSWNSIPVDQERPDMTSLKSVIRRLRAGNKVLVFPEGQRSYDGNLLPGLPGIGLIVVKSGVPVIPVRIFGTRDALPRGGKSLHPAEITLVCGKPWHCELSQHGAEGKELYQRTSDEIMQRIAELHC
jgi:1-acyl-sn-glycerol-3-phosphate acyltransferase